jgi:hypothetical protein
MSIEEEQMRVISSFTSPAQVNLVVTAALVFGGSAWAQQLSVAEVTAKREAFVVAKGKLAGAEAALSAAKADHKAKESDFEAAAMANAADLADKAQELRNAVDKVALLRVKLDSAEFDRDDTRQALFDALAGKPESRQQRNNVLAERARAKLHKEEVELLAESGKAQQLVTEIKDQSAKAFASTDEGSAMALALAVKRLSASDGELKDDVNALMALQDAAAGRLVALRAHRQREGAQSLGNLVMSHASRTAACGLDNRGADCANLPAGNRELVDELKRRKERAQADQKTARLTRLTVQARELSSDEREQRAALAYMQMVERNPNAGWQFGGEAATLTAGQDGAIASIRFSLKRFEQTLANDTTLTLSAPLAEQGRTHLMSSAAADRPKETAMRFETVLVRNLDPGKNLFGNYNQIGMFAQVARQRFNVADPSKLKDDAHPTSRAAFSAGLSNMFAFGIAPADAKVSAVHRVGLQVQRGYIAGDESIRCPAQPEPGETTLGCVTANFDPIKVKWKRALNYRYRREINDVVAIAPAFSYEHTTRTKTYDLPVYLVQGSGDEKGKFTAGIAYRHVSTPGKDAAKAWELFVSSPLSLFGP